MIPDPEGVAFLPRMCVEQELKQETLREVRVEELSVERKIHLVSPAKRSLSHVAKAFLEWLGGLVATLETFVSPCPRSWQAKAPAPRWAFFHSWAAALRGSPLKMPPKFLIPRRADPTPSSAC
jgi:hypothetical protein